MFECVLLKDNSIGVVMLLPLAKLLQKDLTALAEVDSDEAVAATAAALPTHMPVADPLLCWELEEANSALSKQIANSVATSSTRCAAKLAQAIEQTESEAVCHMVLSKAEALSLLASTNQLYAGPLHSEYDPDEVGAQGSMEFLEQLGQDVDPEDDWMAQFPIQDPLRIVYGGLAASLSMAVFPELADISPEQY